MKITQKKEHFTQGENWEANAVRKKGVGTQGEENKKKCLWEWKRWEAGVGISKRISIKWEYCLSGMGLFALGAAAVASVEERSLGGAYG